MTELIVYRASSLGSCPVAQARRRMGYEPMDPPEKFQTYFDRGHRIEEEVKAFLREAGWTLSNEQTECDLYIGSKIVVRGHIDGCGQADTNPALKLLEIKATTTAYFKQIQAHGWDTPGLLQKYKWQVSAYLISMRKLLGLPQLEGTMIFRNHEDDDPNTNTLWLPFEEPLYSSAQIMARVLGIEAWVRSWEVPDTCELPYDYPCPFYYLHPPEDNAQAEEDEAEELEGLAIAYDVAKNQEATAKKVKADVQQKIINVVGDRGKLDAGRATVTTYVGKHQDFAKARFKADHPEVDIDSYFASVPNKAKSVRVSISEQAVDIESEDENA